MEDPFIYLDNAATTYPKPAEVLLPMVEQYMKIGVSPGRGSYDLAVSAEDFIRATRIKLASFFNAPDPDGVIFTANATESLNLAISGIVKPGDHVITTRLEHNSVLRPLYHLQQQGKIDCSLVPFDEKAFIDPEDIARKIRANTKLVIVNHASNVLGTIQPVARVGELCAARKIPFLVDASQSAGQIPVNMAVIKASAIVFTGHKSLYGPTGIGGLIVHPDLKITPTKFGGTGIESRSLIHTRKLPHRLEAGTHNLMGIIGISLGIDYLVDKSLKAFHGKEMKLMDQLCTGLSKIKGVTLYCAEDLTDHLAVLSVNIKGMTPEDTGAILDADFNIAARVGLHCAPLVHEGLGTSKQGTVRFSLGFFNTEAEMDRVIKAMSLIAGHES